MKLAVMQPYFLPYLGYFQLMAAVDQFVLYDDVNFKKRGWINRNRLLLNEKEHLFTAPLRAASQNRRINEIELQEDRVWRQKLVRTIRQAYQQAPQFDAVYPLISDIVLFPENNLSRYLKNGLARVKTYLGISTKLIPSSGIYANAELKGEKRILDICRQAGATLYLNAAGGRDLYDSKTFRERGVTLRFLESEPYVYRQQGPVFYPSLSIMDVLMFNSPAEVKSQLSRVSLRE